VKSSHHWLDIAQKEKAALIYGRRYLTFCCFLLCIRGKANPKRGQNRKTLHRTKWYHNSTTRNLNSVPGSLLASRVPGEFKHRVLDEVLGAIGDLDQGGVPGQECGEQSKETTSLDEADMVHTGSLLHEVTNCEEEKRKVKCEEQEEEDPGSPYGANKQKRCENPPALQKTKSPSN
jgi:hypothetical protein